jgi:Ser/Thr protein kinase RdoA (MazF antagonist)
LAIELAMASELGALDAPVALPAPELPAAVHAQDGFEITFWRYYPQPLETDMAGRQLAAALQGLHAACARISADLKARLPAYDEELKAVAGLLSDRARMEALPQQDRDLLIALLGRLWQQLQRNPQAATHLVIHGSPHPYNVLLVDREPLFIDFETACIGPIEWDLAHMSPDVAGHYPGIDADLLELCRNVVRVKTAAWCWADVNRGDLRYHAEAHLAYLKRTLGGA